MVKAVLDMKMPKCCSECEMRFDSKDWEFSEGWEDMYHFCFLTESDISDPSKKLDNCPLKEV